jgi:hypothetical protein
VTSAAPYNYPAARQALATRPAQRARVVQLCWARADLRYKLRAYQLAAYYAIAAAIRDRTVLKYALNMSRRWGKTFLLCLVAVEVCAKTPKARVRFAAPNLDELRERVLPIIEEIIADAPEHLRPVWRAQRKAWVFPNGARIYLAGVNNQGRKKLRGSGMELGVVDEGAFIDDVEKLVGDVLMPQTLDTRATVLMGSTPPESAAHDYVKLYRECKAEGNVYHADIYTTDATPETIELYAKECGGEDSVRFRREYGAEYVTDQALQIVPDWIAPRPGHPSPYVRAADRTSPLRRFWRRYVILDIGATGRHFTCVLFGHYNFEEARFYVERELVDNTLPRMKSGPLAAKIREVELDLWPGCPINRNVQSDEEDTPECPRRWADNNDPRLLIEMARDPDHPLVFTPTHKESLPRMVNRLGMWVAASRVHVDPGCTYLLDNLADGTWKDEKHIGLEFIQTSTLGHCDGIASLMYGVLNINETRSPVPRGLHYDPRRQRWREIDEGRNTDALAEMFGPPRMDS